MPHLDHFRKQAKLYLRWHREGYVPVAAIISEVLPRFRGMADRAVLAAPFRLSDAQALVARKRGFDGWTALIQGAEPMPSPVDNRPSVIVAAEPQLFVSDMRAALDFYIAKLGFAIAFVYGEPPFYAQVRRDGARLNLRLANGPVFDSGFREREPDALAATLALDDAKPLFLTYEAAGVPFHQRLRTEPWGARTFIVRDPDGNLLAFAGS